MYLVLAHLSLLGYLSILHVFAFSEAVILRAQRTMADIEKHVHHEDDSPQAASSISSADYSHINEKSLLRKLDWKLLPGVSLLYLVSFLDRSNVANARLEGLIKDLHMTGNEYLTGLTVFFVGYISLEVVWNLILKRIGPRLWLPSVTIVWGIVTTLQGILVNKVGFFVIRTALGVAEGALFPGVSGPCLQSLVV
jgi:sugar phosphate permease